MDVKQILELPAEVSIHGVEELANFLGREVAENNEILVDGSNLCFIDACGLQLLIAGFKEAKIRGKPFALVNPSSYFEHILAITGAAQVVSVRRGA